MMQNPTSEVIKIIHNTKLTAYSLFKELNFSRKLKTNIFNV